MNVGPGTELGAYRVIELLGAGGMGEVYLARDGRLGREVALKVLRDPVAADSDLLARFEREARLLASLSHPHIGAIYGVEDHEGVRFLVLELVRGETLSQRLMDRALPTPEALAYAAQIASALEAAHEQGIIHRDLKPGNIKITPSGTVKLLDFGIAKVLAGTLSSTIGQSPTASAQRTGEGTIIGTAAYMSPEQARGKDVDKRSDIWSFGCVLYDMLTGRPAFGGDTASDIIAAILTREPDWSLLPAGTPLSIRRLLARCLTKELNRRLRDIGDARIEIEEAIAHPVVVEATAVLPVDVRTAVPRGAWKPIAAAALGGVVFGAAALWILRPTPGAPPRTAVQFTVVLQGNERIAHLDHPAVAIAPGDTALAFTGSTGGDSRLYVRNMAAGDATPLAGTEGAVAPFFSPDGLWIGFFASGQLKKVAAAGGPVIAIADAPMGFGGSWADDNTIVYAPSNGSALWQVSAEPGGTPRAVTQLDAGHGEFSHRWPEVLPGGRDVIYSASSAGSWDDAEIVMQRLGSTDRRTVLHGGTNPHYLDAGRLLYTRGGSVYTTAFDPSTGNARGAPTVVLEGLVESADGAGEIAVSRAGSIVYLPGTANEAARSLAWVDRRGNLEPLAAPVRAYAEPRLSRDDRTVAVTIGGARDEIWTYEIATNKLTEFTFEGGSAPVWSGDGQHILFSASRAGRPNLFWKPADSSGGEERLTTDERRQIPASATADGNSVAYVQVDDRSGSDIGVLRRSDHAGLMLLASAANETGPAFSPPDGRLLAYVSDASGSDEVYIAPVSDPRRAVRVSTRGGSEPVWRRDGSDIFFRSENGLLAAAVHAAPVLTVESPRRLFDWTFEAGGAGRPGYDVSTDVRFLVVRPPDTSRLGRELRVVLNWRDALPQAASPSRRAP